MACSRPTRAIASPTAADGRRVRAHRVAQQLPGVVTDLVADAHVVLDREVVEELDRLPGAHQALLGPDVGTLPIERHPEQPDLPRARREPGDGVDEARLAGPVRSDEAHDLAGADVQAEPIDGPHAPVGHRDVVGLEQHVTDDAGGQGTCRSRQQVVIDAADVSADVVAEGACSMAHGIPHDAGPTRDADRVEDDGEDEQRPAHHGVVPGDAQRPVEDHVDDPERGQRGRHQCAADARDAAEVRDRHEPEADEHAERRRRQLAPAVADEGTTEPGQERRQREGAELDGRHGDADRGRSPLVGAHRQHLPPAPGPHDVARRGRRRASRRRAR